MRFKTLFLIGLHFLLSPVHASSPEEIETQAFGLIIRPQLIESLAEEISRRQKLFEIDRCLRISEESPGLLNASASLPLWNEVRIRGHFEAAIGRPRWDSSENERLEIILAFEKLRFAGQVAGTCAADAALHEIQVNLKNPNDRPTEVRLWFDPMRFETFIRDGLVRDVDLNFFGLFESSFHSLGRSIQIEVEGMPRLSHFFNQVAIQSFALEYVTNKVMAQVFEWLGEKINQLHYAERLSEILADSTVWRQGIRFEKQAFQIENDLRNSRLEELTFSFFPRSQDFLFLNNSGMELYFNSMFLSGMQVRQLVTGPSAETSHPLPGMRDLERQLSLSQGIRDASFVRPPIPQQGADLSLFLTEEMINKALTNIYLENFLRFRTRVDIASQTKDLISPYTGPLQLLVNLGSYRPPSLRFESDLLRLSVSDYYLSIETYIEDRVIPATEVLAQAFAVAELKVDTQTQTVNLAVSPNTFSVKLSEGGRFKRRLNEADLNLVERIADELWADFFNRYPDLVLFPTLVDIDSMALEINDIYQVHQGMILLDFNLNKDRLVLPL